MAQRINNRGIIVFIVALVTLVLGVGQGFSANWSIILKQGKAKYAGFEKEVKDMTIVQEMRIIMSEQEMVSKMKGLKKGKKSRMETTTEIPGMPKGMGGMEATIICDGKDAWMISSLMGKRKLSGKEQKRYQPESNWWDSISEKAQIVGTEKVGKLKCYVVEIKDERQSPFTKIWLDKKNLELIKSENKEEGKTVLMVFSDFKNIKGDWRKPYKTEMYMGGKLFSTFRVKSLEINKGLSDDLFDPDKVEAKGGCLQEMMKKMMQQGKEK